MAQNVDGHFGKTVFEVVEETSRAGVEEVCTQSEALSAGLDRLGRAGRAEMLEAMADALESRREMVVATADRETALGSTRLNGELTRTCFQLRLFAEVITDGAYLEATIDHPGQTAMGPRPDLRRMLRPLGPVAVFGASNFPLAFSVPGGDTASALAAGCPVIAKVHGCHPQTSVICAEALAEGARATGLPYPPVSLVFGEAAGITLVQHHAVCAVGFTGSLRGGRYLYDLATKRPSPIPFYGELGALNSVVVGRAAAAARGKEIAAGLSGSFTLGVGQFCTKPGLVLLPSGNAGDSVRDALAAAVSQLPARLMLSERIAGNFSTGAGQLRRLSGVRVLAEGLSAGATVSSGVPLLLEADVAALDGALTEECFGPVLVIVRYEDRTELSTLLGRLSPALTATAHGDEADLEMLGAVLEEMSKKVGRIVWNGYPTGVAVAWAMHHGGPFPATTDPLHTSVGAASIRRWLRPVTYQDVPREMLPLELWDEPGLEHAVPRRVDGQLVLPEV